MVSGDFRDSTPRFGWFRVVVGTPRLDSGGFGWFQAWHDSIWVVSRTERLDLGGFLGRACGGLGLEVDSRANTPSNEHPGGGAQVEIVTKV